VFTVTIICCDWTFGLWILLGESTICSKSREKEGRIWENHEGI